MAAKLPTRAEISNILETELRNEYDPTGVSAPNLRPGSRNAVFISTATLGLMRLQVYVADRVGARLLSEAKGADLDDLGRDLYGETRKPGAKATGRIWFHRQTLLGATNLFPKGTRVAVKATASQPAVIFEITMDQAIVFGGSDYWAVPIVAQQEGTAANIDPLQITDILDPVPGWAITTTYGTVYPLGGGAEAETDDEYRRRLAQRSLDDDRQRGTRRAIEAGVGRVPGVADWTVIEPGDGSIIVYAGDAAPNYQLTDAMRAAILAELENWRPLGPPLLLWPYNAQAVTVSGTIYMQRELKAYNQEQVLADAVAAVKRYFDAGRAHPDEYFVDAIKGAIFRSNAEVQHVVLTSPLADHARPSSLSYGVIQALDRFYVTDATIILTLNPFGPLTQA